MGRKHFTPYTITIPWFYTHLQTIITRGPHLRGGNYGKAMTYKITPLKTGEEKQIVETKAISKGDITGNAGKFCVFLTSHEFSVLENARKLVENDRRRWNTICFPCLNLSVNAGKREFS